MKNRTMIFCALFIFTVFSFLQTGHTDEGMWTLDNLPLKKWKQQNFEPSEKWLDTMQFASLRFNNGASGAFVSPNGLVLTNHHVGFGQIEDLSSKKNNYVKNGFFSKNKTEELKCPALELNVLMSVENVTGKVMGVIDENASSDVKNAKIKAVKAQIEKESFETTGLRSNIIELYQGGEYHLYRFKKYTDVRLVMAPEEQAAFFGGDIDNFTYPRHDLDIAFFRVYENNKPVKNKHYFKWSKNGAKEGELVFVSGNPGVTQRLITVSQLEYIRDYGLVELLKYYEYFKKVYNEYAEKNSENLRQAKGALRGIENVLKVFTARLEGLNSVKIMDRKIDEELELKNKVKKNKTLAYQTAGAWDKLAKLQNKKIALAKKVKLLRVAIGRSALRATPSISDLASIAHFIARYGEEIQKPNKERFDEFRESNLESLKHRLFSSKPIYRDLEEHLLAAELQFLLNELGENNSYVNDALGGETPKTVAKKLIRSTKLGNVKYRKQLVDGAPKSILKSKDPLIIWARKLTAEYRKVRKELEELQVLENIEGGKIAKARFAVYGRSIYPDATFSFRVAYGIVKGYEEGTTLVPYKTTFYGLYDRAASFDNKMPYSLTKTFIRRKNNINMNTPLNFVFTVDSTNGNSGSPVFNRNAEFVGILFDGNIQSPVWRYAYDETVARSVAVHSDAIIEVLTNVYPMRHLVKEILKR